MPVDFKKQDKTLYQPKTTPGIIDVPDTKSIWPTRAKPRRKS